MKIAIDQEITLKQITDEYAHELFELVKLNWQKNLCYWCPDLKKTYATLESTIAYIQDANEKFLEDKTPDLLIFFQNKLAGLISLGPITNKKSEIGYWLGDEFEGKGIIIRSMPFILSYAKENLKLKTVELSTSVPNMRSQKIPLRFHFTEIKRIINAEQLSDKMVDHILWSYEFEVD